MVFAFAGDSTITRALAIVNRNQETPCPEARTAYHTLTKFFSGSCFTRPFISSSNRARSNSEGENVFQGIHQRVEVHTHVEAPFFRALAVRQRLPTKDA